MGDCKSRNDVSPQRVRERLFYNPETGKLYWLDCECMPPQWRSRFSGKEAFNTVNAYGYFEGTLDYYLFRAHRVIWAIVYGEWPDGQIDHIDGNRKNNRIENLRIVTNQENAKNSAVRKDNTSGVIGVSWHNRDKRWIASIKDCGFKKHLGSYRKFEDAIIARKNAEAIYGFHSNHGKIL